MPSERASTTEAWYRTRRRPRTTEARQCIHTALAERARREPDRTLLVDANGYVTQRELATRIEHRASALAARAGAVDRTVAVALEPGVESVISYFACLAAGLRYLPLPPSAAATEHLVERLAPDVLVTRRALAVNASTETLLVDSPAAAAASRTPLPEPDPRRIAHVLPTSGTTGDPKAVLTDHVGSMLSHAWRAAWLGDDPGRDVIGCNLFGIWDVVPALFNGVPLVMLSDDMLRDPDALAATIVRYAITRLMLTPTLLDACLANVDASTALGRLRCIVLCGEPVTETLLTRAGELLPGLRIVNLYSLAECHDVAAGELEPGSPMTGGRVAEFADVYVTARDDCSRLVAVGEPGRVLVGGAGLAVGYVDAERTAARFFEASFDRSAGRVYDTGDLGVLHADGRLEIRGRIEAEVKIRGTWADPEALEAVLGEHSDVARAAVVAEPGRRGHTELSAFVVARAPAPRELEAALHRYVREHVDAQNVPARIRLVTELPLTASGKIDTRRLRVLERAPNPPAGNAAAAATGALENDVLDALRRVLERADISRDDDLETLGVDSLATIGLAAELERVTHRRVRVADLAGTTSAASIAEALANRSTARSRARWQLPDPIRELPFAVRQTHRDGIEHVLVTGATGTLGRRLVGRLLERAGLRISVLVRAASAAEARARLEASLGRTGRTDRLEIVTGDLGTPRLGLEAATHAALAEDVDAIVHAGANLDMFADFAALEPINVGGTRAVLELAAAADARLIHVSSSAALPLASKRSWDETASGRAFAERIAPGLASSDGYSRTKLGAEALVWDAAALGLDVTAVRIPHLVGPEVGSRLAETLDVLGTARVVPEGPWSWQLAPVGAAVDRIEALLERSGRTTPLVHVTTRPLGAERIAAALRRRDARIRVVSVPATVAALARATAPDEAGRRLLTSVERLTREYGPRAALSLADAELATREPLAGDADRLLDSLIQASRERIAR